MSRIFGMFLGMVVAAWGVGCGPQEPSDTGSVESTSSALTESLPSGCSCQTDLWFTGTNWEEMETKVSCSSVHNLRVEVCLQNTSGATFRCDTWPTSGTARDAWADAYVTNMILTGTYRSWGWCDVDGRTTTKVSAWKTFGGINE